MKIKITESQAKRFTDLLKESSMDNITVKKTDDGSIVFNDKIRYNLEVKKLGMWNEVDILLTSNPNLIINKPKDKSKK